MTRRLLALLLVLPALARGADGDVKLKTNAALHVVLTDAAAATGNGVWVDVSDYATGVIECTASLVSTVEIDGDCNTTRPADSANGYPLLTAIVNPAPPTTGIVVISPADAATATTLRQMPRWIKTRVTAWTSGTVNCWMLARRGVSR